MKSHKAVATIFAIVLTVGMNVARAQDVGSNVPKPKPKPSKLISSNYDKKKGITTVRMKRSGISRLAQEKDNAPNFPLHQMDFDVLVTQKGESSSASVEGVVFNFYAVAGNYVFLRPANVIAVIDRDAEGEDRAMALGMANYKSLTPKFNSVYEEVLSVTVTADVLTRMGKANALELFVGPVGYKLTEAQLGAIRDLAGFLPGTE